jgi:hypothetical protein
MDQVRAQLDGPGHQPQPRQRTRKERLEVHTNRSKQVLFPSSPGDHQIDLLGPRFAKGVGLSQGRCLAFGPAGVRRRRDNQHDPQAASSRARSNWRVAAGKP